MNHETPNYIEEVKAHWNADALAHDWKAEVIQKGDYLGAVRVCWNADALAHDWKADN